MQAVKSIHDASTDAIGNRKHDIGEIRSEFLGKSHRKIRMDANPAWGHANEEKKPRKF